MDWKRVHDRLEASRETLERGWEVGAEKRWEILRSRARELGARPTEEAEAAGCIEIVEFMLASERYGVESALVREVYPLKDLAAVPCTPAFVLGIINVRGQIVSVVDLKKFFDLTERGITESNRVIIVSEGDMEFGILADGIVGVRSVPVREVQSSVPTMTGIRAEYLKGITGDRTVILDAESILTDENIVVNETVDTRS